MKRPHMCDIRRSATILGKMRKEPYFSKLAWLASHASISLTSFSSVIVFHIVSLPLMTYQHFSPPPSWMIFLSILKPRTISPCCQCPIKSSLQRSVALRATRISKVSTMAVNLIQEIGKEVISQAYPCRTHNYPR